MSPDEIHARFRFRETRDLEGLSLAQSTSEAERAVIREILAKRQRAPAAVTTAEQQRAAYVPPPLPIMNVQVVDVDISFPQMVWLLVKLALAAIPAMMALTMIGAVIALTLMSVFGGLSR